MHKLYSFTYCLLFISFAGFFVLSACDNPEPESRRGKIKNELNSGRLDFLPQEDEISSRHQVLLDKSLEKKPLESRPDIADGTTSVKTSQQAQLGSATDEEALTFIKSQCIPCHDAKIGSVKSFWAFDPETISKAELLTSTMAPTIYYSMRMRSKNIEGAMPAAMPVKKLSGSEQVQLVRVLSWFEKEGPAAVAVGHARYGGGSTSEKNKTGVILDYKCEKTANFREYIRRIANDAFGREPTLSELEMSSNGTDQPVTSADRKKIAAKIVSDSDWQKEFIERGLRKFSAKMSGSADIQPLANSLTLEQTIDLKDEFYQLLKANLATKSLKEILLSKQIMVSANTASLYGCAPPPAGEWAACEMTAPRGSYFTTFSYLRSKPSSFLVENNNYGRVSLMYFVIRGDVFKAALDQESIANDAIMATPSCLISKDHRGRKGSANVAPFGTLSVPKSANSCQSCHIHRKMAAGSILFRDFDKAGHIYGTDRPITNDPDYSAAIADNIVNSADAREVYIDAQYLQSLLDKKGEQACIPSENGKDERILQSVEDLAKYLIGDGLELSVGLARHIPRAMSNTASTTEELIIAFNKAWESGGGKLLPIFEAYFASETYACSTR